MIWLLIYVLAISLYDLRTQRIPNWYTLPLIVSGLIVHFPGHLDLWFASLVLLSAWASHWMGAGDVKLWMALLWALPTGIGSNILLFMFGTFIITGLVQILWRIIKRQPVNGLLTPGAWRTIPFVLLYWYAY